MASSKLTLASAVVAGAALLSTVPAQGGAMFNVLKLSAQQAGLSHQPSSIGVPPINNAAPDQWSGAPNSPDVGTEYFAVDTGGAVFFLGGILADSGNRFDLAGPLSLDELALLSSAKPAILALLGLALLVAGLINRRRGLRAGGSAS